MSSDLLEVSIAAVEAHTGAFAAVLIVESVAGVWLWGGSVVLADHLCQAEDRLVTCDIILLLVLGEHLENLETKYNKQIKCICVPFILPRIQQGPHHQEGGDSEWKADDGT